MSEFWKLVQEVGTVWLGTDGVAKWVWISAAVNLFIFVIYRVLFLPKILRSHSQQIVKAELQTSEQQRITLEATVAEQTEALQQAKQRLEVQLLEQERTQKILQDQAQLLDLAHDAILTCDLNHIITFWNHGAEVMYGISKQEALGKVTYELLHTQFPQPLTEIKAKIFQEECWEGELIHTKQDGTQIVIDSRWSVERDWQGNPVKILEINRNITAARQAKARLQAILNQAPFVIYLKDLRGNLLFANQHFLKIFNLGTEAIIGKNSAEAIPQEIVKVLQRHDEAALTARNPIEFSEDILQSDGIHAYSSVKFTLSDLTGNPNAICGIYADITNRKRFENALRESEQRFRKIFDDGPLGMAIISLNYQIVRANPLFCKMTGYLEEEVAKMTLGDITYPDDLSEDLRLAEQLFEEDVPYYKIEKRLVQKNQTLLWVTLTLSIVREWKGEPLYYLAMVEDITERKVAEEALQKSENLYRQLFEVNQAIKLVIEPNTGAIIDANPAASGFYGYELEHLKKMRITDINASAPQGVFEQMEKVQLNGYNYSQPYHKLASGEIREVEVYSSKFSLNHQPLIYSVIHDITERKQAEKALQESEAILRSFYNSAPMMMGVVEVVEDDILHLFDNIATAKFFKTTVKTLKNQLSSQLGVAPEQRQKWLNAYRECQQTGEPVSFEYLHPTDSGPRCLSVIVSPILDTPGKYPRFSYIAEDTTKSKQSQQDLMESERRFHAVFDQTFQFAAILKPDGTLLDANQSVLNFYNQSYFEVIGKPLWQILRTTSSDAQTQLKTSIQHASCGKLIRYEMEIQSHLDHTVIIDFSLKPLKDDWGNVILLIAEGRDITEIKQAQTALQQANFQLNDWVQQLETRNQEIILLGQLSDILQACWTLEEAHQAIARLVQPLFPDVSGAVFLLNRSKNLLESVATWKDAGATTKILFAPSECWGLRRGKSHFASTPNLSVLCQHINASPMIDDPQSNNFATLCVPMMAQGEALGILYLSSYHSEKLTEAKRQLATTVAEHIALALANIRLHEALKQQSIRDPLTNLFNRRYLEESLTREINRAERKQHPLAIIMMDVDHFKLFNDTYGHEAGDIVLRELGMFIQQQIRVADIACRYGGEEFLVIMPEVPLGVVKERAEQMRDGFKHLKLQSRHQELGVVTISVGVAIFPHHGLTGEAVIRAADSALYQAKQQGRDQVVVFNSPPLVQE